ncbi:hypothetical protein KCU88_g2101, partial [Aureobasidium melanogenum]
MPIPVRTDARTSSKANKAGDGSSHKSNPQNAAQVKGGITGVPKQPSQRGENVSTAVGGQVRPPQTGLPRSVPTASQSTTGHTRSYSTTSTLRNPSKDATSEAARPAAPSSTLDSIAAPSSQLHGRRLSASTRLKGPSRTLGSSIKPDSRARRLPEAIQKPARPLSGGTTRTLNDKPSLKKPEFTNYNQQYSPKRTKQVPLQPCSTIPPGNSGSSGTSSSSLTSALVWRSRDELLQLMLVHEEADNMLSRYANSITSQLASRSDLLREKLCTLESFEGERQGKANFHATKVWLDAGQGQSSTISKGSDRLLVLALTIRQMKELTKQGALLDTLIQQFDKWQAVVLSEDFTSAGSGVSDKPPVSLAAALDSQWPSSMEGVQNKIQACAQELADLQAPSDSSALGHLIKAHSTLADQLLQEIAVCQHLQRLIVQQEQKKMDDAVARAVLEAGNHAREWPKDSVNRKGIWDMH